MSCNRQHKSCSQPTVFATTTTVCRDVLQPGGARSCIRFAPEPRRRHGMVATSVRLAATIHGEAATSRSHPMVVVTTIRRGDHDQRRCCNCNEHSWNQFVFLLQSSPIFATTVFRFCWNQTKFCYHLLYFAGTGISFCFHRVGFLLEPVSHLSCFHRVVFFARIDDQFFASTMFCFAGIDIAFCYNRYWLRATPERHLMLQPVMRTAGEVEGQRGRRGRPRG